MLKLAELNAIEYTTADLDLLRDEVAEVCRKIPPLWDLSNYVAVNPFLGFAGQAIAEAARDIDDGLDAQVLPDVAYYRTRWQEGAFTRADLEQAARHADQDPAALEAILSGHAPIPLRPASEILTFAEQYDYHYATSLHDKIIHHATRWCSVHIPETSAQWFQPTLDQTLYAAWLEATRVDRSLEIAGLVGWRDWAKALPPQPDVAIMTMLERLAVPAENRKAYLYRLLSGVFGWACLLRRSTWEVGSDEPGALMDLLAIRICTDAAVPMLARRGVEVPHRLAIHPAVEDESVRIIFQDALENSYARQLLASLAPPPAPTTTVHRPAVQAVFCIDVRSEPLRRHLEAQSPDIQTFGFAGFFGISLDWRVDGKSSPRCPVLLKPTIRLEDRKSARSKIGKGVLKHWQTAPASSFTFVETLGLAYGIGLVGDALNYLRPERTDEIDAYLDLTPDGNGTGIPTEDRLNTAVAILKNLGLRETFARLILLCGHEGHSANNPHAAGLDCGACGGHGGAINARVAAAILNDPVVRAQLPSRGYNVPADTYFVPGVHNTTVDEVKLLDTERLPTSHRTDLAQLKYWLGQAELYTRAERSPDLGLAEQPRSILDELLRRRSYDWSEVRPEWGLARNAAFIAARRERTRGVNLHGRCFLHEYNWTTDPDNSILTLILSAPMVVASWINLQYFASTVDNCKFGSGTKALHNRVGSLGVVLGNGGDLRTGLALQSVHTPDGRWYHEPLRLQVVVEAPQERIAAVLAANTDVRNLVENGWVRLFALDPDSTAVARWVPGAGWQAEQLSGD